MNFATTKQRILEYLDFKGITVTKFFEETGIKRGFLDTDKLNMAVTDLNITKIIAKYNDLNLIWLLTGKGKMIFDFRMKDDDDGEMLQIVNDLEETYQGVSEIIKSQKETINVLKVSVDDLRSNNQSLQSNNLLLQKLVEEKVFG